MEGEIRRQKEKGREAWEGVKRALEKGLLGESTLTEDGTTEMGRHEENERGECGKSKDSRGNKKGISNKRHLLTSHTHTHAHAHYHTISHCSFPSSLTHVS